VLACIDLERPAVAGTAPEGAPAVKAAFKRSTALRPADSRPRPRKHRARGAGGPAGASATSARPCRGRGRGIASASVTIGACRTSITAVEPVPRVIKPAHPTHHRVLLVARPASRRANRSTSSVPERSPSSR
jgi:hypothetical protein